MATQPNAPWAFVEPPPSRTAIPFTDTDSAAVLDEAVRALLARRGAAEAGDAGATLAVLVSIAAEADPPRVGTAIAAVTLVGYIGAAVGPPLVGALASAIGLRIAFAVVPAAALTMTLLVLALRRGPCGPGS